jgi:hypothetical protein
MGGASKGHQLVLSGEVDLHLPEAMTTRKKRLQRLTVSVRAFERSSAAMTRFSQ